MALATGSLWGYSQDQDRKREAGQVQQNGITQSAPQAAANWLTPVKVSLKKQISVSVLLPLRGFPKLTFSKFFEGLFLRAGGEFPSSDQTVVGRDFLPIFIWGFSHRHFATVS